VGIEPVIAEVRHRGDHAQLDIGHREAHLGCVITVDFHEQSPFGVV
jgi:hypothetical protein